MVEGNIGTALLLSALAGLATTVGSVLALAVRRPGPRFLSFTLGFSAGVMIFVSFIELLPVGIKSLGLPLGTGVFLGAMLLMLLIDVAVPHEYIAEHHVAGRKNGSPDLLRTGLFIALGIGIHNFPEGMATFVGTLQHTGLGISIAVAVGLHNIPEGLAVSMPIYAATGSRRRAFLWSFLSGLAEPLGALIAALVLAPVLTPALLGWMLAAVAGVMVFISIDELVPVACSYGHEHMSIVGVIIGMAAMAASLWLLK
jgi:ZIP family zinc transporter